MNEWPKPKSETEPNLTTKEATTQPKEKAMEMEKEKTIEQWKKEWQDFYREVFRVDSDFSKIRIPQETDDRGWLSIEKNREVFKKMVIMKEGIDVDMLVKKCGELELFRNPGNANTKGTALGHNCREKITSERNPSYGSYAIWTCGETEPDEEMGMADFYSLTWKFTFHSQTETIEERLTEILFHFHKTGKVLESELGTLCMASKATYKDTPSLEFTPHTCIRYSVNGHGFVYFLDDKKRPLSKDQATFGFRKVIC